MSQDPDKPILTLHFAEQNGVLPYPYHVLSDGRIGRQDVWKGHPLQLAGFQDDLQVNAVDLDVEDFLAAPEQAQGKYPVFIDADDGMGTLKAPVDRISRA